jgi:glutaredoxin 3
MPHVKIYTTDYCPFCRAAKNLLNTKEIEYEEIRIENFAEKDALVVKTGHPTVPQIFIDDEFVGGFEELRILEESGELDEKLGI